MTSATTAPAPPARIRPTTAYTRVLKWSLAGLFLLVAAAVVARWATTRPKELVHYETVAVDRGPIAAKVTATGTVSSLVTVLVGSQVSGRINTLGADFGSQVRKGQTIATIDPSLFRAASAQARANLASAKAAVERAHSHVVLASKEFARAKALFAEGLASRSEYDSAEASLAAAKADEGAAIAGVSQAGAALAQAELNLRYTTIVSPIDGVVISRNVDVGQTVAASLQAPTLFTIAQDLTRIQVDTNVAEADIGKLRAGMKVEFTVDAYPAHTFKGVVRQVRDNATTLQNVVTYDAVIDVDNSERLLKPGMTASVTFTYATRDDALRLPNAALRFKPDRTVLAAMGAPPPGSVRADERLVWLLRGGRAVSANIKVGISDGTSTEVLSGQLGPGDHAIVEANAAAGAKRGP
jgi:HlyD family secretion protein